MASQDLPLLQAPVEVIEFFLQDLIGSSEGRLEGHGVDGFLLDLYQDPLGFRFHLKM
jgi:hypothetical protein